MRRRLSGMTSWIYKTYKLNHDVFTLDRMQTAQRYLNGLVAERSKARLLLNRPVSPKRPGRWTSLFCRSDPLSKDTEHQNSSLDSNACSSASIPSEEVTTSLAQGSSTNIYSEENIQGFHEMDLELDFQGLHIREQTVGIESSDSWLTPGSAHDAEDICISTPGNPWVTGTSRKSKCIITRLYLCLVFPVFLLTFFRFMDFNVHLNSPKLPVPLLLLDYMDPLLARFTTCIIGRNACSTTC